MPRQRVAIVGSGCAGLGALWALKSTDHEVHLFESDSRLGGHTNTVSFKHNDQETLVDTGFIVFNSATYPNFIRFLEHVNIKAVPTEMSFGISRDGGAFEWAGGSLSGVFAQKHNLFNLSHWKMIYDVIRFNQYALDLLRAEDDSQNASNGTAGSGRGKAAPTEQSIGAYLDQEGYSAAFRDNYLLPMTAAIWSTGPEKCALEFPATTLVRFMWNHHLLTTLGTRPDWLTLPSCSQSYIDAILHDVRSDRVHVGAEVLGLEEINGKIIVQFEDDEELFDHVILAVHGDDALDLVGPGGTDEEREILDAFETSPNLAVLHSDPAHLPRRAAARSAWNLQLHSADAARHSTPSTTADAKNDADDAEADGDQVCLTYDMNALQHIPRARFGDVLVTLNPATAVDPATVRGSWTYRHPRYTAAAVRAQRQLHRIQAQRGISYAGAWTGYGFHEDGFSSGLKVAVEHLGATLPFEFTDSTFSRGKRPRLGWRDVVVRVLLWYVGWIIWWFEPYMSFLVRVGEILIGAVGMKSTRGKVE